MSDRKPGTRVHIEFDAVIDSYLSCQDAPFAAYRVREVNGGAVHWIFLTSENSSVIEPTDYEKYGPPQVGDIWADDYGREYVALSGNAGMNIHISSIGLPVKAYISPGFDDFKTLNPKLVRRRGLDLESERHRGEHVPG